MAKHETKPAGGKHTLTTEPKPPVTELTPIPEPETEALAPVAKPLDAAALATVEDPNGAPPEQRGFAGGVPYVGHYGEKAKATTRAPLDAAGVKVGQFYLFMSGMAIPLESDNRRATIHVLRYTRLFTKQDSAMNILETRLSGDKQSFNDGFREHIFATVAVRIPEFDEAGKLTGKVAGFIPASFTVRGGQAQALDNTIKLLKVAGSDGWKNLSPAHRESAAAVHVGGRIVTQIWSTPEDLDDGSGNTFNKGHGVCRPSNKVDVEAFNAWYEQNLPLIGAVAAAVAARVDEAKKKIKA